MTQLEQLLQVLQEEFSLAAPDIDTALMQWLSEPAGGPRHAGTAGTLYGRLAQASRLVGLEGAAIVFELLRDTAQLGAELEGDDLGLVLGWLAGWQPPMGGYLDRPAEDGAVKDLATYLDACPAGLTGEPATGTGYVRQPVSFTGSGTHRNAAALRFGFTTAVGTLTHVGIFDALAGGNALAWATLGSPATLGAAGSVTIPAESLTVLAD